MNHVRLIFAVHNHQPVGNFDGVFEESFAKSYEPFLEILENYPNLPVAIHTSGPLLDWLIERKPRYIEHLKTLANAGRVEILGGGRYEPILTMIPPRDRVAQIKTYSHLLQTLFGRAVRGMWLAERVWEQCLASDMADGGAEFTILDDFHFQRAGLAGDDLLGYHFTEDQGRLLKLFPASEKLRYLVPFSEPHETYQYLRSIAERTPARCSSRRRRRKVRLVASDV